MVTQNRSGSESHPRFDFRVFCSDRYRQEPNLKAIICQSFDHPSNLTLSETEAPDLADHEVLIDIAATGLGYVDASDRVGPVSDQAALTLHSG